MDNVKIAWVFAKKYHFWILCGSILVVSLVCWWLATGSLADQFEGERKKIQGAFQSLNGLKEPKNMKSVDAVNEKKKELDREIFGAWEVVYQEQKKNRQYPGSLGPDLPEFKQAFESLDPATQELSTRLLNIYQRKILAHLPTLLKIGDVLRNVGDSEAKKAEKNAAAKKTAERNNRIAGKKTPDDAAKESKEVRLSFPVSAGDNVGGASSRATGGFGAPMGARRSVSVEGDPADEIVGVVDWANGEYERLYNEYDGSKWKERPSTLKVVCLQEDLWAYETVLGIIRAANVGAVAHDKAAIKRINFLRIGREAAQAWFEADGLVFKGSAPASFGGSGGAGMGEGLQGGGMGGEEGLISSPGMGGRMGGGFGSGMGGGMSGGMGGGMSGSMGGGESGGEAGGAPSGPVRGKPTIDRLLIQDRYVDDFGDPVEDSETYPYYKPAYDEFNMLPFCVNVMMDERKLATLLVAFANSKTPIEIRRVRFLRTGAQPVDLATINPAAVAAAAASSGSPGGNMMPGTPRNMMPGTPMGSGSGSGPRSGPGSMMGMRGGGMMGMQGSGMMGMQGGSASRGFTPPKERDELNQYDMPIEIHGVIYIFKPPRVKQADGETAEQKPAAGGEAASVPAEAAKSTETPPAAAPAANDAASEGEPAAEAAMPEAPNAVVPKTDVPKNEEVAPNVATPEEAVPEAVPATKPAPATGEESP